MRGEGGAQSGGGVGGWVGGGIEICTTRESKAPRAHADFRPGGGGGGGRPCRHDPWAYASAHARSVPWWTLEKMACPGCICGGGGIPLPRQAFGAVTRRHRTHGAQLEDHVHVFRKCSITCARACCCLVERACVWGVCVLVFVRCWVRGHCPCTQTAVRDSPLQQPATPSPCVWHGASKMRG